MQITPFIHRNTLPKFFPYAHALRFYRYSARENTRRVGKGSASASPIARADPVIDGLQADPVPEPGALIPLAFGALALRRFNTRSSVSTFRRLALPSAPQHRGFQSATFRAGLDLSANVTSPTARALNPETPRGLRRFPRCCTPIWVEARVSLLRPPTPRFQHPGSRRIPRG